MQIQLNMMYYCIYFTDVEEKVRLLKSRYLAQEGVSEKKGPGYETYYFHLGNRDDPNVGRIKKCTTTVSDNKEDIAWVCKHYLDFKHHKKIAEEATNVIFYC